MFGTYSRQNRHSRQITPSEKIIIDSMPKRIQQVVPESTRPVVPETIKPVAPKIIRRASSLSSI